MRPLSLGLYRLVFRLNQNTNCWFLGHFNKYYKEIFCDLLHIKSNVNTNFYEHKFKFKKIVSFRSNQELLRKKAIKSGVNLIVPQKLYFYPKDTRIWKKCNCKCLCSYWEKS